MFPGKFQILASVEIHSCSAHPPPTGLAVANCKILRRLLDRYLDFFAKTVTFNRRLLFHGKNRPSSPSTASMIELSDKPFSMDNCQSSNISPWIS
jgi:hypothetical protein